jgi:hypothetical protein
MDLQTREEIMSDQQVPVLCLHVTISSLPSPVEPHPEIMWSGLETKSNAACTPEQHPEVMEHHTALFIPSFSTELMIHYDSRRLLHAYAADTLNTCEIVACMRIYEKQQRY